MTSPPEGFNYEPKGDEPRDPPAVPGGQAASRVLRVLKTVATSPTAVSASEVAERSELNRTTAWRMLQVLQFHGFVDLDEESSRYQLGASALLLFPPGRGDDALIRRSLPALSKLAEQGGETVNLSVPRAGHAIAIHQIDPPGTLAVDWVGRVFPPHLTSDGKIYLAFLDAGDLEQYVTEGTDRYAPADSVNATSLRRELEEVRSFGVAYTLGELDPGLNGISVGVQDGDGRLVAIVSLTGPAHRASPERLKETLPALRKAATEIRSALRF